MRLSLDIGQIYRYTLIKKLIGLSFSLKGLVKVLGVVSGAHFVPRTTPFLVHDPLNIGFNLQSNIIYSHNSYLLQLKRSYSGQPSPFHLYLYAISFRV